MSFPLCGHHLLSTLKRLGHVKFLARKQLILFLKGIGLPYGDALQLFQQRFTKHPEPEVDSVAYQKKKKNYSMSVTGLYGIGGKDYSPYTCGGVLSLPPGNTPHQCHGCPYKHSSSGQLRKSLPEIGVPPVDIEEIVDLAANHRPREACARAFEASCEIAYPGGAVGFPHDYYARHGASPL